MRISTKSAAMDSFNARVILDAFHLQNERLMCSASCARIVVDTASIRDLGAALARESGRESSIFSILRYRVDVEKTIVLKRAYVRE
ncbi:MAG: hypothetical protein OXI86_08405 [Candidatus Poribacteria bacterium]|nr:hypothetical protein [Candidatus Poribacteria bacterium]